jgi:hypothetical protein
MLSSAAYKLPRTLGVCWHACMHACVYRHHKSMCVEEGTNEQAPFPLLVLRRACICRIGVCSISAFFLRCQYKRSSRSTCSLRCRPKGDPRSTIGIGSYALAPVCSLLPSFVQLVSFCLHLFAAGTLGRTLPSLDRDLSRRASTRCTY